MPQPPRISIAHPGQGARLHAPAAERNADALLALLKTHAPQTGTALEIASGTGQHVTHFASHLPGLIWQPSDVAPDRLASIADWSRDAPAGRIAPPITLDATQPGWSHRHNGFALIQLTNLLHLITTDAARTLITEAAQALAPGGRFIAYGPFLRAGQPTSNGDRQFHTALQAQGTGVGYKNNLDVLDWLQTAGLTPMAQVDMPANNIAFVSTRDKD